MLCRLELEKSGGGSVAATLTVMFSLGLSIGNASESPTLSLQLAGEAGALEGGDPACNKRPPSCQVFIVVALSQVFWVWNFRPPVLQKMWWTLTVGWCVKISQLGPVLMPTEDVFGISTGAAHCWQIRSDSFRAGAEAETRIFAKLTYDVKKEEQAHLNNFSWFFSIRAFSICPCLYFSWNLGVLHHQQAIKGALLDAWRGSWSCLCASQRTLKMCLPAPSASCYRLLTCGYAVALNLSL